MDGQGQLRLETHSALGSVVAGQQFLVGFHHRRALHEEGAVCFGCAVRNQRPAFVFKDRHAVTHRLYHFRNHVADLLAQLLEGRTLLCGQLRQEGFDLLQVRCAGGWRLLGRAHRLR